MLICHFMLITGCHELFIWVVLGCDKTCHSEVFISEIRAVCLSLALYWQKAQKGQRLCCGKELDLVREHKGSLGGWSKGTVV
jgi:hypothetical protein